MKLETDIFELLIDLNIVLIFVGLIGFSFSVFLPSRKGPTGLPIPSRWDYFYGFSFLIFLNGIGGLFLLSLVGFLFVW
jgi:hypothetical protein